MNKFRKHEKLRSLFLVLILTVFLTAAGCGNSGDDDDDDSSDGPDTAYEFRSTDHGFEVRIDGGDWKEFFTYGMNFGLAVPGTSPGEFAATPEQIQSWIEATAELGCNVIRVYTVQMPHFYEKLHDWNMDHQDNPMFLMQGAWIKEPTDPPYDYLDDYIRGWFTDEIEKAVDVVHGNRTIQPGSEQNPDNWGRAYGEYTADVSPWLLGYLIGRELEPYTIENSHTNHSDVTGWDGTYMSIEDVSPIEAFVVQYMDYTIGYEAEKYGQMHTIGFSNWPTLDPIDHYTEPPIPVSSENAFSLDLTKVKIDTEKFKLGQFVSYHAYPYYPDFILYQPEYQVEDAEGLNTYLGYLEDLRNYHDGQTLIVGEIGIPSSQGSAHYTASGMNHGGYNDIDQAAKILRTFETIVEADLDGGFLFSIIDEWFKRAWVVDQVDFPGEARLRWFNAMSPEQNFGLIAMLPGSEGNYKTLDGNSADWDDTPLVAKSGDVTEPLDEMDPMRNIKSLDVSHDEGYLFVKIEVEDLDPDGNDQVDWDKVDYLVAFDTIDANRGDSKLDPDGYLQVESRVEFLLEIKASDDVNLYVDRPYDLYGLWHGFREAWQLYETVANDEGEFNLIRTITNEAYIYEGQTLGEQIEQETGRLPTGDQADNSITNFWYSMDGNTLEIRVPWNLLNFTDPSTRTVVDGDDGVDQIVSTSTTDGVAVMAVALGQDDESDPGVYVDSIPQAESSGANFLLPEDGVAFYSWTGWEVPTYHQVKKNSYFILQEQMPDVIPSTYLLP